MRVLTLTPFYPTASDDAAGCFTAEPLKALHKLGIESNVIAVQPIYRSGPLLPEPTNPPVNWTRYPCLPGGIGLSSAGGLLYATLISKVRRLHRNQPINLIHAHAALPCGHTASLLGDTLGIPWVVTVHGLDVDFSRQVNGLAGRWCEKAARLVYSAAAQVIGISSKVRDRVVAMLQNPRNTTVVYNGVDCSRFYPSESEPPQKIVLSVGNLIPIKGHDLLLRAFAVARRQSPELRCEIIGDGPERRPLERLASELGIANNVQFLGRQSRAQVAEAMRRCSVFALPSRYEGLGCVYLEAMATAKPIIACRVQGIDEIVAHNRNGWLIDVDDLDQLATALVTMLEDPTLRRRLGTNARQTVLESLTLDHQAARLAAIYKDCAA